MKILELAQKIKDSNEEKLGKINEKRIAFIIRESLAQIKKEIEKNENESIRILGLGNFKTKIIEQDKDGNKILKKRIIFNPAKERSKEK